MPIEQVIIYWKQLTTEIYLPTGQMDFPIFSLSCCKPNPTVIVLFCTILDLSTWSLFFFSTFISTGPYKTTVANFLTFFGLLSYFPRITLPLWCKFTLVEVILNWTPIWCTKCTFVCLQIPIYHFWASDIPSSTAAASLAGSVCLPFFNTGKVPIFCLLLFVCLLNELEAIWK